MAFCPYRVEKKNVLRHNVVMQRKYLTVGCYFYLWKIIMPTLTRTAGIPDFQNIRCDTK